MRAVGYQNSLPIDDPAALVDIELPKPEPAGRDLLVEVRAISVNPVDTKVRRRAAPKPAAGRCSAGTPPERSSPSAREATSVQAGRRGVLRRRDHPPRRQFRVPSRRRAHRRPQAGHARLVRSGGAAADLDHRLGDAVRPARHSQAGPRRAEPAADRRRGGRRRLDRDPVGAPADRRDGDRHRLAARDAPMGARSRRPSRRRPCQAARGGSRGARPRRAGVRLLDHQHRPASRRDRRS